MLRRMINLCLARWAFGAGFAVAAVWTLPSALAGEVRVDGGDCASAVHLLARDAALSDVLKRLAKSLDFGLSFESGSDPLVNIDAVRPPIDLLLPLASLKNVVIERAKNPRCPQRERIVKVWVLPDGRGAVMRTTMTAPDARQPQDTEEPTWRAQEGIDMILSAHGIPTAADGEAPSP
jgi:hypothetical protein